MKPLSPVLPVRGCIHAPSLCLRTLAMPGAAAPSASRFTMHENVQCCTVWLCSRFLCRCEEFCQRHNILRHHVGCMCYVHLHMIYIPELTEDTEWHPTTVDLLSARRPSSGYLWRAAGRPAWCSAASSGAGAACSSATQRTTPPQPSALAPLVLFRTLPSLPW